MYIPRTRSQHRRFRCTRRWRNYAAWLWTACAAVLLIQILREIL